MQKNPLGRTGIMVSDLCLGTMTYGTQTEQGDAHRQMDMALAAGINFIDCAEVYPVNPMQSETAGRSEEILGTWFARTGRRADWVLATKHAGAGGVVRGGAEITAQSIPLAIEGSLKRLQTDYIDLYQFHWPNRGSYMFRKNWRYDPAASGQSRDAVRQHMADCLGALQEAVDQGRIRAFGLSNDSAWGTAQWLQMADETGGPRVASIQNEYSLLCRLADTDLAELMHYEDVGLLPFSPLGAGFLTGKYQNGACPEGSRMSINGTMGGRKSDRVFDAVAAYIDVAQRFELDLAQMALAWSAQRPFVTSSIFGATSAEQLAHLLKAADLVLGEDLLEALDDAHKAHPMPY